MTTITTTINVCDRCGRRSDAEDYCKGNSWGQTTLSWFGDQGGRSWNGDSGGVSFSGKAWLCENCTGAFLLFMKNIAQ